MKEIEYLKPENFDKNNQEFYIFNDVSQESINSKISNFKNVRVSTNSVIFKYFKVFRENCIHDGAQKQYSTS